MRKTIIATIVLCLICSFTAVISLAVCGGEVIKSAVEYGVEYFEELDEKYDDYDDKYDDLDDKYDHDDDHYERND